MSATAAADASRTASSGQGQPFFDRARTTVDVATRARRPRRRRPGRF